MKEYFRVDEVAKIFDVNKRTIERLIEDKDLCAVKVRGCTRIHRTEIEELRKKKRK